MPTQPTTVAKCTMWCELVPKLWPISLLKYMSLAQAWSAQDPAQVRQVCRGFQRCLEAVVNMEGGYIDL